jgi:hypothetical protein
MNKDWLDKMLENNNKLKENKNLNRKSLCERNRDNKKPGKFNNKNKEF